MNADYTYRGFRITAVRGDCRWFAEHDERPVELVEEGQYEIEQAVDTWHNERLDELDATLEAMATEHAEGQVGDTPIAAKRVA